MGKSEACGQQHPLEKSASRARKPNTVGAGCAGSGKTGKGATAAGEPKLSAEVEATDEVEVVDEVDNSPELFAFFGR